MNLQQLRTFVATARTGHLTRAAERLFLSQPAASAQLKALEQDFGLPLFVRHSAGLELTAAGRHLLVRAESLLLDADALLAEARKLTGKVAGKLRIGAASDPQALRIGEVLSLLARRHPLLETSVQQRNSAGCYEALRAGELDAGFALRLHVDASLALTELCGLDYVVAAPAAWQAQLQPWTLQASAALLWVLPPAGSAHEQMLQQLFGNQATELRPAVRVDNEHMIRHCVARGVGLSLVAEHAARQAEQRGDVVVAWDQRVAARLVYAHVAERASDPLISVLSEAVHAVWQGGGDAAHLPAG